VAALFISDLHIDASRPAIVEQFLEFLATEATDADALYILGDLFETWIGDDAADAAQAAAIAGLHSLTSQGVPCFVMHGNRDFLLAAQFCRMSGALLLPDPLIVTLYGEPVLVMHGDALCSDDRAYQRLRATVREPDWQRQFLALSVASRAPLASAARRTPPPWNTPSPM
jgi:UDP-2,3-diacylglucosamine hydrolase